MNMVKKAGGILLSVLLWGVILVAALYTVVTLATRDEANVSSIAGFSPLVVKTDSMSPAFNADDLILIHTTDPSTLQVGDIVTFHTIINNEYALNTHRIADIAENNGVRSYTTKGDNNAIADQHTIADGDIVGKYVTRVPGVGRLINFLSSSDSWWSSCCPCSFSLCTRCIISSWSAYICARPCRRRAPDRPPAWRTPKRPAPRPWRRWRRPSG